MNFEYVTKNEAKEVKKALNKLINLVQDEVRENFTFRFDYIGSEPLNMITYDTEGNTGFDFDVNIRVNDPEEKYNAKEIKDIIMNGFNKYNQLFDYDYSEDSTRVITIKFKDTLHSRIIHSCDFAVVFDCSDGRQQYIRHTKKQNSYYWEYQPEGFDLEDKISWLRENGYWNEVREYYLYKKNNNTNLNKKSRSLRAEAINEKYQKYHG
ncbi:MAG: hypothetical protein SOW55_02340 [Bacilli bacterium]|nr:hypothetical protein [Bacillales bacterium]MDY2574804.1 hypothetical protein [Bacilli bacterium]